MKELDLTIENPTGLHARPATVFVHTAKRFKADIRVQHGTKKANAKSVISVLTLGVEKGGKIRLIVDGPDEDEALAVLKNTIEEGLGEEHPASDGASPDEASDNNKKEARPPKTGTPKAAPAPTTETKSDERIIRGIPAATGIAIGPLFQFQKVEIEIDETAGDPEDEKARLKEAVATAQTELESLHAQVQKRIGAEEAAIFEAHQSILTDPELHESTVERIDRGQSAAKAWQEAIETTATQLAGLQDELLAARAADVRDVGRKVLRILAGVDEATSALPDNPVILVADDLSPSDTATFDAERVMGFCTATGGANAHTAILARALGLPAVVGAGPTVLKLANGTQAILNGDTGALTLEPDAEALAAAKNLQAEHQARRAGELKAAKEPATTQDGHQVEVVANIGSLADARQALQYGAEGVGLLRTEFLFLDRADPPTETEQFKVYRDIAVALEEQPVIIRTLDVGGDKPLSYLPMPNEENPFLGQRGIRLTLARPELLRTQLRAIYRAAEFGPCRVMFPMVANLQEWSAAKKLADEARAEVKGPEIELGIMVEIPAAGLLAPVFAQEVDFFSIGTNDLTQYTLAMDRTHPELSAQADGLHPAVLHLIDRTVKAAHAAGKWVGVCGELGADPQAVPILVGLGVDELSVAVPSIPAVKAQIRALSLSTAKHLAAQALECATATEVRRTVESIL